jgi:putative oxidoreductase
MIGGHGFGKFQALLAGRGRTGPFGMEGMLPQFLITFAEFFCSMLILVGLATSLAAIPLVCGMLTAVLWGHAGDPFFPMRRPVATATGETVQVASAAKELALLYLAGFATLFFTGAGRFSLDHVLARSLKWRAPAPATAVPDRA